MDQFEPSFLMLQLYYLYCKFKHTQPGSTAPVAITFKDHDRKPLDESDLVSPALTNTEDEEAVVSPQENLEIIHEVDSSVELNSSKMRSKRTSGQQEINPYLKSMTADSRARANQFAMYDEDSQGPSEMSAPQRARMLPEDPFQRMPT